MTDAPIAYRPTDAMKALGIGRTKFYELIADGRLRKRKLGGCTIIPRSELERLIEELPER